MTATQPTNTLVITGLDREDFPQPGSISSLDSPTCTTDKLQALIAHHVPVVHWAPLKSFGRILVVLQSPTEAQTARSTLSDYSNKHNLHIKSYYYTNTPLYSSPDAHLHPPEAPHLFFISPPPSPPVGWTSRPEEPPRLNTPPVGLVSMQEHGDNGTDSDAESVNGLEMNLDSDAFHSSLRAALEDLEASQVRRERKVAETQSKDEAEQPEHGPVQVVSNAQGKLTRRITLHDQTTTTKEDSGKPVLSLQTNELGKHENETIVTPTIILEWDDDENDEETVIPSTIKSVRTGRPPLSV
ncbi:uncharacterized protein SAPINGB_P002939 [Magnusiomyces paraingens]|uniref:Calcipressin n=1 Tax=Magnusiomyces paraingens TaxID=2606893 RepID=A0A5E8BN67_9ASCO|nr:uncharacterized protein SAPINGB_P002939 [Saprochaete ingens]VVT50965.1 unnamed protein product [Saprochaete ingens]